MYLDKPQNPIEFQGYGSTVKVTGPDFLFFHFSERAKKSLFARLQ